MKDHFENNNLLYINQSGFRRGYSCETALELVLSNWKDELDKNNCITAVFVDFKRAFETVDRHILLQKLEAYGIGGTVLKWFQSYLTNRKQVTKFKNLTSEAIINDYGVPQGSVLGPLLFIIYINDMSYKMMNVFVNVFADDTLVSCSGKPEEIGPIMNEALDNMNEWLKVNKLKINIDKTKCMVLTSSERTCKKYFNNNGEVSSICIKINGRALDTVEEFKYLGVIIDQHLKLNTHVQNVAMKLRRKTGFLSRIARHISPWARLIVYKTIVSPHLDYCCTLLWDIRKTDLQIFQRIQNRCMRVILRCNKYNSIRSMLETLQLLSVEQRIALAVLLFIFKIVNGLMPRYLDKKVDYGKNIHDHDTRTCTLNLTIDRKKKTRTQKSLFYSGYQMYNRLSIDTKLETRFLAYKYKCIGFIKAEISNL